MIGKQVRIISDNENYAEWMNRDLTVVYASNSGCGYDSCMYPELLLDLIDSDTGEECPFALYEWEVMTVS